MNEFDYKVHAMLRRQKKLLDMKDGLDFADRVIPSGKEYRRTIKHRPRTAYDWEELEF